MEIKVSSEVNAPVETIWSIFENVTRWPRWVPSFESIRALHEEKLRLGSTFSIKQRGMPWLEWKIIQIEIGKSFAWECRKPGVTMRGEHCLRSISAEKSSIALVFSQTGVLGTPIGIIFREKAKRMITLELDGLKTASEAMATSGKKTGAS
jgi:uncharacterized membrane protein